MANWNLYQTKLNINGNSIVDRQVNQIKQSISNDFQLTPSYRSAYFNDDTETTDIQVLDGNVYYQKNILMDIDKSIDVGDILTFDSEKWLCVEADKTNPVYQTGKVLLCNNHIHVLKDNITYEVPIVIESNIRLYSMGVDDTKYLGTPNTEIIIRMTNNSITSTIKRDDIYTVGLNNYKITDISDIIEVGLLIVKMDYTESSQVIPNYSLTILNGANIQISNTQTLTLDVEVIDTNDNSIVSPTPSITFISSNTSVATVSSSGLVTPVTNGNVTITAHITGNETVSDSIAVIVSDPLAENLTYDIVGSSLPDSEVKINQTKTYTVKKYNNGVEVSDPAFNTSVITTTIPSSAYTFTILSNNTFSLKCNAYPYYITIRSRDTSNNLTVEKTIKLDSLI